MCRIHTVFTLFSIFAMPFARYASAQELLETQRTLAEAQEKLGRIRMMLPAYTKDRPLNAELEAGLESATDEIRGIHQRLTVIEKEMQLQVAVGFEKLSVHDDIGWRVAPRQGAFLAEIPKDVSVVRETGQTIIRKSGNLAGQPIAPSPSYHVCPSFGFVSGDRAAIRFSIPQGPSTGGTPVPYFGVRDVQGNEMVLGGLIEDGKEHEVRILSFGDGAIGFYDGILSPGFGKTTELKPPLFLFFHMNDTSQLKVHQLRLSQEPKTRTSNP